MVGVDGSVKKMEDGVFCASVSVQEGRYDGK